MNDQAADTYAALLNLQETRVPFQITTGLRIYENMLIHSFHVSRDKRTALVTQRISDVTRNHDRCFINCSFLHVFVTVNN